MRGIAEFNFPAFDAAKADLEERGYDVISPADIDREMGFDPKGMEGDPAELQAAGFDMREAILRDCEVIAGTPYADTNLRTNAHPALKNSVPPSYPGVEAVVVLPGWENSSGSRVEVALAEFLGLTVLQYPELEQIHPIFGPLPSRSQPAVPISGEGRLEAIKSDRQQVYGDPLENHEGIAKIWAPLLQPHWMDIRDGIPVPAHVVALLMVGLKLDRMRLVFSQDNYDDLRNYLSFAEEWQRPTGTKVPEHHTTC